MPQKIMIELSDKEWKVLSEMAEQKGMTVPQIVHQSFRVFQIVNENYDLFAESWSKIYADMFKGGH